MPYYLPQAIAVWLVAIFVIQWGRWRELLLYGLLGSYLCLLQDHLGSMTGLWQYSDVGPFDTHDRISLLISVSAAPLFAMFFVQGLKVGGAFPWKRILGVALVAMVPEVVGLYTGNITHGGWWNNWTSLLSHLALWSGIWLIFRVHSAKSNHRAG